MKFRARTDLACESMAEVGRVLPRAKYCERTEGDFRVCDLRVENSDDSALLNRPIGAYITVECGPVTAAGATESRLLSQLLARELRRMTKQLTGRQPDGNLGVLVAGLGNENLTADAIGPRTARRLTATRHLQEHEASLYLDLGCASVSALAPGVLGQTGIETLELLQSAAACVHPDLVIVIDALAARSCDRLASTVQISDAGIQPGSGVGNRRSAISRETLGIPVIAVGVPTVVDSATLVYDALAEAGIQEPSEQLIRVLERGRSFFVSPKDSDAVTACFSEILARAIDLAFVGQLEQ